MLRSMPLRFFGLTLWILTAHAQTILLRSLDRPVVERRLDSLPGVKESRFEQVRRLFEEAGCAGDRLQEAPVKRIKTPNLVCTLPGSSPVKVIVGAHFDKVNVGSGAVDNWTGVSLLPSLYHALGVHPRALTFAFVAFTEEETGSHGARAFAKQQDPSQVRAMVNIDSLGLSPTKIWVRRADKQLVRQALLVANALHLPVSGMDVDQVGDSDSHPFADRKIPVIDFHSLTSSTLRILHSPMDRLEAIRRDDFYDSFRLIAAFLAYLDSAQTNGVTVDHN
jgi:putative aminopeptidase FrvX